jgi:hypothetical protein
LCINVYTTSRDMMQRRPTALRHAGDEPGSRFATHAHQLLVPDDPWLDDELFPVLWRNLRAAVDG